MRQVLTVLRSVLLSCALSSGANALLAQGPPQIGGNWLGPFAHGSHLMMGSTCPANLPLTNPPTENTSSEVRFWPIHAAVIPAP